MPDVFENLKHFTRKEAWGDPSRMNETFLITLDQFREIVGHEFHVLAGFATSGHVENSMHYQGRAVDGRFMGDDGPLSLGDHICLCLRSPFTGIGIYTWGAGGPFVHFDNRPLRFERKIWVSEKQGEYLPLSDEFLKKHLG